MGYLNCLTFRLSGAQKKYGYSFNQSVRDIHAGAHSAFR